MSKIFVHIGLPKTATTTLQKDIFPSIDGKKINYLGIKYPRETEQTELYRSFYSSISTGQDFSKTKELIENELKNGENILISEEMIVLSSLNTSWSKKIENLYNIISDFDYKVIVTVREPAKALFSYYVEIYQHFKNIPFMKAALENDYLKIFHYKVFFSRLSELFKKENIFIKKFEEIIDHDIDDLLEYLEIDTIKLIEIDKHNVKSINDGKVKKQYNETLLSKILVIYRKIGLNRVFKGIKDNKILKKIMSKAKNVSFNKNFDIPIPDETEMKSLRNKLNEQNEYLFKEFGIKY